MNYLMMCHNQLLSQGTKFLHDDDNDEMNKRYTCNQQSKKSADKRKCQVFRMLSKNKKQETERKKKDPNIIEQI